MGVGFWHGTADHGDTTLLSRMSAGDATALGDFYDRWVDAVTAVVTRISSDREHAESSVEAVFWQAWLESARYTPEHGTPGAWLILLARRTSVDRAAGFTPSSVATQ